MEKFDGKSMDIVRENVQKLKKLFPEVFIEGKIDFDRLKQILGDYIEEPGERYSLNWKGKSKALKLSQTPSMATLRPSRDESKNWDTTRNIYIQGENLEVLKLLQKAYYNKIKVIYIDPPYNTGNDFIYKDNFRYNLQKYLEITGQKDGRGRKITTKLETSGRFHTDWLNMMYPRLRLARNLLSNDGVIFISIDDNELANLIKICDEIFGKDNFVANFVWRRSKGSGNDSKYLMNEHDYILLYAKDLENIEFNNQILEIDSSKYKYRDKHFKERGGYYLEKLDRGSKGYVKSLDFGIKTPDGSLVFPNNRKKPYDDGWRWVWSKSKVKWGIENDYIVVKKGRDNNWNVYSKTYAKVDNEGKQITRTRLYKSHIGFEENILNIQANHEMKRLFGKSYFSFPKPTKLLKYLIKMFHLENDIILDFFAGSCTTAHAVMELNAEDNGNRRFIMVQFPEPTDEKSEAYKAGYKTISEIGKERIHLAGEKILKKRKSPENLDIGFKVFNLDSSNIKEWNPDYNELETSFENMIENFVPGRGHEDILYEIMLKYGIDLISPIEKHNFQGKKLYNIGSGALFVCLEDDITLDVIEQIINLKDKVRPKIPRVVFKDFGFSDDSVKTNVLLTLNKNGIKEIICI